MSDICKDFMYNRQLENSCARGNSCKYIHDSTICFHFWKNGSCKYNDTCKKSHKFKKTDSKNQNTTTTQRKRNTETFVPMKKPVDVRIVCDTSSDKCSSALTTRDIILLPNVFSDFKKGEIYDKLIYEIQNCGIDSEKLLKLWHGNDKIEGTHLIVNDKTNWKSLCPTFNMIIERIKNYFNMDIQATRLNLYKDTSHWKPFHFDAAAVKPDKADVQNFTVAISFGASREAAFEHADTKTVISIPHHDGWIYVFTKDTNIIWRHGILQEKQIRNEGRISVIAWGWVDNMEKIN